MGSTAILCSERECKARVGTSLNLSIEELKKQVDKCNNCGDWLIKSNQTATHTANELGAIYALKMNEASYRR